jgi:hypothetical protein
MILNVGSYIYCHTTGKMENSKLIFAIKGKKYKIEQLFAHNYSNRNILTFGIVDEKGAKHTFSLDELLRCESKWFRANGKTLLVEKSIENYYLKIINPLDDAMNFYL